MTMRGTTRGTAGFLAIITLMAVGTSVLVNWKMRGDTGHLRALLAAEIDRGSLVGLGRAQAIGRRVVLADRDDAESAAALAFAGALLATEFGQGTVNEAESAAARAEKAGAASPNSAAAAIASAARALVALRKGDRQGALTRATAAAEAARDVPHARCALGRVRAAMGDLVGASYALEAAMVEAPGFLPAKIAWAEVRLDLGDAAAAQTVLVPIVARAPEDIRARLLLEEASQALAAGPRAATAGGGSPPAPANAALESVCAQNGALSPFLVAGCALGWSSRARIAGDRFRASTQAQAAARRIPDEPRMLARTAQALAQQGAVDDAEKLLDRAFRYAAPEAPALAWARLAVTLGHGRAAAAPPGLRPTSPAARVFAARAALAAGGAGALDATLASFGPEVVGADADLRLMKTLTDPRATGDSAAPPAPTSPPAGAHPPKVSPAQAYVDGLRARLGGDLLLAAERLSHALHGHADACRAAGEYIATLRAQKLHPDPTAFSPLRAENSDCVNLPALK
jgi:tetratricopeptide (TPR) repeat protein